MTIEFTDWAKDILRRSDVAARRFNPEARIRIARVGGTVQAVLADQPSPGDTPVELEAGGVTLYVEGGLEGQVDIEEPHDRVVLKPLGSPWNDRAAH